MPRTEPAQREGQRASKSRATDGNRKCAGTERQRQHMLKDEGEGKKRDGKKERGEGAAPKTAANSS